MPIESKNARGRLKLICGSMFAGKTKRLIADLRAAAESGRRTIAVKHALDARYHPGDLATHDGQTFPAEPAATAEDIERLAERADVLGIDEGHFFGRALTGVVESLKARGRSILVVGLDFDAWGRPFPPFPELKELADEIVLLRSPCTKCGRPAPHSQRMKPVTDEFMVGGLNDYEPRCAACFEPLPPPAPEY